MIHEKIKGTKEVKHRNWKAQAAAVLDKVKKLELLNEKLEEFSVNSDQKDILDHMEINSDIMIRLKDEKNKLKNEIKWSLKENPSAKVHIIEHQIDKLYKNSSSGYL